MSRRPLVLALILSTLAACASGGSAAISSADRSGATAVTAPPTTASTVPPTTLRRITSVDECSPVPEAVGLPNVGSTENVGPVTIFFEDDVSLVHRERVRSGLEAGNQYILAALGGFRFQEPICVDVRAGTAGSTVVGAVYGVNHIVLYTGAAPLATAPGWLLAHVTAHELVHFWQKGLGNPRDAVGPVWLLEGAAELLAYEAIRRAGLADETETRTYSLRRVEAGTPSLESMERRPDDPDDFSYPLSYLATELLTGERGPTSLRDYWRALSRGSEWEAAFSDAFGVSPQEFYLRFEAYRGSAF